MQADAFRDAEVLPGVRATSRELVAVVLLDANVSHMGFEEPEILRGLDPGGYDIHGIKIVEGRAPKPGEPELVIGTAMARRQPRLKIGGVIHLPTEDWQIVGVFGAHGSIYENEAWGDRKRLATATKNDRISAVLLAANSAADAQQLVKTINGDKRFGEIGAQLERDARGSQAKLAQVTRVIFILVVALCIIGVVVTATNLHASLISRLPELVTFVALGVRRTRVSSIMLMESLLLAGIGFVVAIAVGAIFHGRSSAMFSNAAFFELRLSAVPIIVTGALALLVGMLGGLAPTLMVRRIDLVRGLR
jgi:putative ABC transport system permease protein